MADWLRAMAAGTGDQVAEDPLALLPEAVYGLLTRRAAGRSESPDRTAAALLEAYCQMGGGTLASETPEAILAWALVNDL